MTSFRILNLEQVIGELELEVPIHFIDHTSLDQNAFLTKL